MKQRTRTLFLALLTLVGVLCPTQAWAQWDELHVGQNYVNVSEYMPATCSFTPDASGTYRFYSQGGYYTQIKVSLDDSQWTRLGEYTIDDYDYWEGSIIADLTAGECYTVTIDGNAQQIIDYPLDITQVKSDKDGMSLTLGDNEINIPNEEVNYVFTPEQSGTYQFELDDAAEYAGGWVCVLDQQGSELTSFGDGSFQATLKAGTLYTVSVSVYDVLQEGHLAITCVESEGDDAQDGLHLGVNALPVVRGHAEERFTPQTSGLYYIYGMGGISNTIKIEVYDASGNYQDGFSYSKTEMGHAFFLESDHQYAIKVSTNSYLTINSYTIEILYSDPLEIGDNRVKLKGDDLLYYFTPEQSGCYSFAFDEQLSEDVYNVYYKAEEDQYFNYCLCIEDAYYIQLEGGKTYLTRFRFGKSAIEGTIKVALSDDFQNDAPGTSLVLGDNDINLLGDRLDYVFEPQQSGYYMFTTDVALQEALYYISFYTQSNDYLSKDYFSKPLAYGLQLEAGEIYTVQVSLSSDYVQGAHLNIAYIKTDAEDTELELGSNEVNFVQNASYIFTPAQSGYYLFAIDDVMLEAEASLYDCKQIGPASEGVYGKRLNAGTNYRIYVYASGAVQGGTIDISLAKSDADGTTMACGDNELNFTDDGVNYTFSPDQTGYYKFTCDELLSGKIDVFSIYDDGYQFKYRELSSGVTWGAWMMSGESYRVYIRTNPAYLQGAHLEVSYDADIKLNEDGMQLQLGSNDINIVYNSVTYTFVPEQTGYYRFGFDDKMYEQHAFTYDLMQFEQYRSYGTWCEAGDTYFITVSASDMVQGGQIEISFDESIKTDAANTLLTVGSNEINIPQGWTTYTFTPEATGFYLFAADEDLDGSLSSVSVCDDDSECSHDFGYYTGTYIARLEADKTYQVVVFVYGVVQGKHLIVSYADYLKTDATGTELALGSNEINIVGEDVAYSFSPSETGFYSITFDRELNRNLNNFDIRNQDGTSLCRDLYYDYDDDLDCYARAYYAWFESGMTYSVKVGVSSSWYFDMIQGGHLEIAAIPVLAEGSNQIDFQRGLSYAAFLPQQTGVYEFALDSYDCDVYEYNEDDYDRFDDYYDYEDYAYRGSRSYYDDEEGYWHEDEPEAQQLNLFKGGRYLIKVNCYDVVESPTTLTITLKSGIQTFAMGETRLEGFEEGDEVWCEFTPEGTGWYYNDGYFDNAPCAWVWVWHEAKYHPDGGYWYDAPTHYYYLQTGKTYTFTTSYYPERSYDDETGEYVYEDYMDVQILPILFNGSENDDDSYHVLYPDEDGNYSAEYVGLKDDNYVAPSCPLDEVPVTQIRYKRDVRNIWGTICVPYELTSNTQYQLYAPSSLADDVLMLSPVEKVEAGQPAIFKKLDEEATQVDFSLENAVFKANSLHTHEVGDLALHGTFEWQEVECIDEYRAFYYIAENKFWQSANYLEVPAYRAYFTTPASEARSRLMIAEDVVEALNAVFESGDATQIFDVNGRQLQQLQQGVNVVRNSDGTTVKVLVK